MSDFTIVDFSCQFVDRSPGDIASCCHPHCLVQITLEEASLFVILSVGHTLRDGKIPNHTVEDPEIWLGPHLDLIVQAYRLGEELRHFPLIVRKLTPLLESLAQHIFSRKAPYRIVPYRIVQYESAHFGGTADLQLARVGIEVIDGYVSIEFRRKEPEP